MEIHSHNENLYVRVVEKQVHITLNVYVLSKLKIIAVRIIYQLLLESISLNFKYISFVNLDKGLLLKSDSSK